MAKASDAQDEVFHGQSATPPVMTKDAWRQREAARVRLTRSELEYLGQLVVAGRALLRDNRPVPSTLKNVMSRLGVSTVGL